MTKVVGVRFNDVGKVYYFSPGEYTLHVGSRVIVETSRGVECGEVVMEEKQVDESELKSPLKGIVRIATRRDREILEENKKRRENAHEVCEKKIEQHHLDMKLVDTEVAFDRSKITFYFTADGRVDFRGLVKDLACVLKTRIELRQIGVRDEAKKVGGLGVCGRPFCCSSYMGDFQPVSIKMAKEQGLSLSPVKISGTCGRLMCCLKYEQEAYDYLLKITPKCGAIVETKEGRGVVTDVNLLTGILKVKLDNRPEAAPMPISRKNVKLIKDSRITLNKSELDALKNIE